MAQLPNPEILPIWTREPISLNAIYQVRDFLTKEHLQSVLVVTGGGHEAVSQAAILSILCPMDPIDLQVKRWAVGKVH
jgi:hypothetical protein